MQQIPPPSGGLFPDTPQQPSTPLFASNMQQTPQPGMQQTGSVPVLQVPRYATGQLRALHGTQPVQQMPPMSAMPVAPVYAAQQTVPPQPHRQQPAPGQEALPISALEGTPLMVRTVQGTPVAVTAEEMERALEEHAGKSRQKQKGRQKKESREKQKQSGRFSLKFSVAWCIFGVIGIISVVLLFLEWVAMPVLVLLQELLAGGGV